MTLPILPPVLRWTQKEQLSRKRGVIKQVIFKKQAKNPKFLISSSWHSENKTSAQNLIKYKVIFNTVVQVSSLGHSCGSPYIPCCLRGWLRAMWTDESSAAKKGRPASFSCSGLLWMWGRKTLLFCSFLPPSQPSPGPGACSSHWDKPDEGGVHPKRGTCGILRPELCIQLNPEKVGNHQIHQKKQTRHLILTWYLLSVALTEGAAL